uniref:SAP domain-containing protein n=1 Tax=Haemonchus contortus TaxID=6289 RepID=A0A7I4YB18_HAECO
MDSEVRLPSGKALSTLKVKDLQKELSKRRLSSVGKKAELLARLTEFFTKGESHISDGNKTETTTPKVSGDSKQTTEKGHDENKKSRRRSHSRLNETFEYIEDGKGSPPPNNTVTPQGNSTSPLVNAYHRKSSRQSKDRHSHGDGENVVEETARPQTPRSSRKSRRSSVIQATTKAALQFGEEFLTDDESEANLKDSDICSDCMEKENVLLSHHKADTKNRSTAQPASDKNDTRYVLSANRSLGQENSRRISETSKQPEVPVITPASKSKRCGGFAASTLSSAVKKASRKSKIPSRTKPTRTIIEGLPSSSRSIKKSKGNGKSKEISPTKNFARQHARMFAKMETIGDMHERVTRKHEQVMQAIPDVVKRLATPKSVSKRCERERVSEKKTGYVFDVSKARMTVNESSFKFGKVENYPTQQIQGTSGAVVNSFTLKTAKTQDRRDVKSRTKDDSKRKTLKKLISVTVPTDKESINLLATPKGMTPSKPRGKVSYTPHRGVVTFVDTTKLSDREYELAVASGLIKAKSTRSSVRLESSSRASIGDILNVKRKLNIVQ